MYNNWQESYRALQDYLAGHPEIEIRPGVTSIPSAARDDFYRYFDDVRTSFVRQMLAGEVAQGEALAQGYRRVSQAVMQQAGLEGVDIPAQLGWFLADPVDGLARLLFNPLFSLLSGKLNTVTFATQAWEQLHEACRGFQGEGYRYWVALALLGRLQPDRNYQVPAIDNLLDPIMGEGHERPGWRKEYVPEVQAGARLSFVQNPVISFIVPKVLMHSARLGLAVAMHTEFYEAQWSARCVSDKVEWYQINALRAQENLVNLRPDITKTWTELTPILPDFAVYTAASVEDLALVADTNQILRPELHLEIMEQDGWYDQGKLDEVVRHHRAMRPRQGTFIICREAAPAAALTALAAIGVEGASTIRLIQAGYDESQLEPVAQALQPAASRPG